MKAAVVEGKGILKVKDVPDLKPGEYQALVKIRACSICNGTDRKIIDGKLLFVNRYPGILGHESVGEVMAIGSKVSHYKPGDLVFRPGAFYEEGADLTACWGGFAEYGVVNDMPAMTAAGLPVPSFAKMQQVITQPINPVNATILITYKEALSWLQKFRIGPGQSVLIWGTGPVGLSFTYFAKLLGAYPVIVCGRREEALADAVKMGADYIINTRVEDIAERVKQFTQGQGVAKVVEAVGDFDIVRQSIGLLAPEGEIGVYGIAPSSSEGSMDSMVDLGQRYSPWSFKVMGPDEAGVHQQMMDLLRMGLVDPDFMVDAVIPLDEIHHGFDLIRQRKAKKVVVSFD